MKLTSILVLSFGLLLTACSDVEFSTRPNDSCTQFNNNFGGGSCTLTPTGNLQFNYAVTAGKVDILFVVDNSGSMYTEQTAMATRFPNLVNSISTLDWQIAVITTDISGATNPADAQNGNGTFQDGKLITFPNGAKFITKTTPNAQTQFEQTIKRPETLTCDNGGPCPSGDERGIFATNLAVEGAAVRGNLGSDKFFRPEAHLAIVVLSDEGVRSNLFNNDTSYAAAISGAPSCAGTSSTNGFGLESRDLPETLVTNVRDHFGTNKVMSVHPVIVRTTVCNTTQNNQQSTVNNCRYGFHYAQLGAPNTGLTALGGLVTGTLGNICSSNYTTEMGNIGNSITQNVSTIKLACNPLSDPSLTLDVQFNGVSVNPANYSVDSANNLILNPTAGPGVNVTLSYTCPN